MEIAGIAVGLLLAVAAGAWYRSANRKFSERVLGYDLGAPQPINEFVSKAPSDTGRMLRAIRTPSTDAVTEQERILLIRRLKIFIALMPVFVLLPLIFDIAAAALSAVAQRSIVGVAVVLIVIGLLGYRSVSIARIEYDYGKGGPLRWSQLGLAIAGVAASIVVLVAVVTISS